MSSTASFLLANYLSVNSSCLATQYPTLSIPCFKIGKCGFHELAAFKAQLLNENTTEFWINTTDTDSCFERSNTGSMVNLTAELTYDTANDTCKQTDGNIQLGVSSEIR